MRVLVVEDQPEMNALLVRQLNEAHYSVDGCLNGNDALDYLAGGAYDAVVLDVMLPGVDGLEVLRRRRAAGDKTPVLLLTARDGVEDRVRGLDSGADDYMTKPVNFEELGWRIDALLRRSRIANEGRVTIGDVVADRETYCVTRGDEVVELPSKEFQLLFLLLSYPNKILTKENILDTVWGYSSESDENTVRTHINRLRNKFEGWPEFEIVTMRGIGYKAVIKK